MVLHTYQMRYKYYTVFQPFQSRGVYDTWDKCSAVVRGVPGSSFASFKTQEEATAALAAGSLQAARKSALSFSRWRGRVITPCIAVDAACSGCPGPVEFRGVVLPEGFEAFRCGPFKSGTNNVGEFLAIVHGLRWLDSLSLRSSWKLYSDSATAINWTTSEERICRTKRRDSLGKELRILVEDAERWLKNTPVSEDVILKWETSAWGEIPADFGRKKM